MGCSSTSRPPPTPPPESRVLPLCLGTGQSLLHASAQAPLAFKPRSGSRSSKGALQGCDHSGRQRTTTGNPVTAKMHEFSQRPLGLNSHPPAAVCHPPKACWQDLGLIHAPLPSTQLVGWLPALGARVGVSPEWLFAGVNLDILNKKERD